jgi:alpha-tubulin suppressor-like RCC1 family protein
MAVTPAGDALFVINAGSRTISKVDLNSFTVVAEESISTPNTYSLSNPLYVVAGESNKLYYTDGAWGPEIYFLDFNAGTNLLVLDTGGNEDTGAGGIALNRAGNTLYAWRQYGWGAGDVNSWVTRYSVTNNGSLIPLEDSFTSWRRDPLNTPVFLDAADRWVFNKEQMFSATNVSVLLAQYTDNIYAISLDGSIVFGPNEVFNAQTGILITNLPFATTVQTLSGDQKKLFRYNSATTNIVIYDMASIAAVSGLAMVPTPADGSVVALAPTNLVWSPTPTALSYDVYFGTNQSDVAAATVSSSLYLGRISTPGISPGQPLVPGSTYYWRVDVDGFNATNAGSVWSFTISQLAITPAQVSVGGSTGYNPANASLSLTGAVPTAWTATVSGAPWLAISSAKGTTPATVTLTFNTAAFPAGIYTNNLEFVVGAVKVEVPVTLNLAPLNIVKMAADLQRPYLYALQPPVLSGQNGQLLFINATNGNIDKTLPIGINPVDETINYGEGRLYIASWGEAATYVVDLNNQTLLPPLQLGTDIYKINAGKPGRIITEGEDQWVGFGIVDTESGTNVYFSSYSLREGDGECSPNGTIYYHCDNNISDAYIHKYLLTNDTPVEVAGSNQHPYGSRNLVLSPDGTTLFWQGYVYDANLNELESLGEQIYATTAHGDLALGVQHVFNTHNGQTLYTWPFSSTVMAVSGDQQNVFLYNSTSNQIVIIPMSSIASVPGAGLSPNPADGSVINPPLPQVSWTVSPLALSYQVYMGTSAAAVAAADTNSALYLGPTSSNSFALSSPVIPGSTYYWRVDSVGFSGATPGAVWSFTVSALSVTPQTLSLSGVTGLPILPQTISLAAPLATSWTLAVAQPWISVSASNNTTPSSVTLNFNTTNLPAGLYTNQLTLTANGVALQLPVALQLFDLNASKIVADPARDYIYVLHPGSGSLPDAFLLFLNTDTGIVEKVIPIGINPTDMTVNRFEDRLYVSNWQHNQTQVVDLKTQTELTPLALGSDIYKINAGRAGRIVTESEDQWVTLTLFNTTDGASITTLSWTAYEGDGEFDPSGQYYYHVDSDISDAAITKYDMSADTFNSVGSAGPDNYWGSRNLVMSLDGSRLFWTAAMYDTNLNNLGAIGSEIYASSTNGSIAFGSQQAFDTSTKLVIYNLPVSSSVEGVDRMDQRLWYFDSGTHRIESVPLSFIRQPSITQQPATNTSVTLGGNINLGVTAMGLNPLFYQWTLFGTNLVGQTNYFLSLNGIQSSQQGNYQVIVSNFYGAVTSTVAQVTVLTAPTIVQQPAGTHVFAGQTFTLSVAATGTAPLTYQWTFENVNLAGATNSTVVITNAQAANEGIYRATVQNSAGSAASGVALVRVDPAAPSIVSGPGSLVVPAATNVVFGLVAIGSQPMAYQWFFNGAAIPGATTPQYSISDVQSWNAGNYQVLVTNGFGSVTSSLASLGVTPVSPYFVVQPLGAILPGGTNWTLTAQARGSEPLSYYWQHDGVSLVGAYQTSLTLTNLKITDSGNYAVVGFNTSGSSTSLLASITVTAAPPVFVQQPVSASASVGANVTFSSLASGSNPLRYQWCFQGSPLANQTNRQLTLNSVTTNAAGSYFAIANNQFGNATSSVVQLTVNQPPVLQEALSNLVVNAGGTVTLAVAATGNSPLAYSWQFNGTTITGANASLVLTNIQAAQAGFYRVTINNQYGSASSTAKVSVLGTAGLIVAWGDNSGGQTNAPNSIADAVALAGGDYHSLALLQNGTLVAWGYDGDGQTVVPTDTLRFVSIAAGASHNLAVRDDGSLVAWGRNDAGQTNIPARATNVLAVAAGDAHSVALLGSRTIVAWGDNSYGQTSVPQGLNGVAAIAAGRLDCLALRTNGVVVGWGYNAFGQATPPSGLSNVIAIAAGYLHSAALLGNGTVLVWGDDSFGQTNVPASVSNVVAIAAGDFDTLALRADGKVIGWGDDYYQEIDVPPMLDNAFSIAAGNYHGLALTPIAVQAHASSTGLVLQWSSGGILQWATAPGGPFTDVPCLGTCFTNIDMSAPAKFFRVRH